METRTAIRGAARDLFLEAGLVGFSMRKVATRCGVTAPAIYRHYRDKDALLSHVVEDAFQLLTSYLERHLHQTSAAERFRSTCRAYANFALEQSHDYALLFMTDCAGLGLDRMNEDTNRCVNMTMQFLCARINEGMSDGTFKAGDCMQAALYAWSQLHGLAGLWLIKRLDSALSKEALDAQIEFSLDRLLDDLMARQ